MLRRKRKKIKKSKKEKNLELDAESQNTKCKRDSQVCITIMECAIIRLILLQQLSLD